MSESTHQPEIYMQAKRDRLYLRKLRVLPPSVYEALIRRLVKGDSINSTAKYLNGLRPELALTTARKYLTALAREIGQEKDLQRLSTETKSEINAFNEALEATKAAPAPPPPLRPNPPPTSGDIRVLKSHVVQASMDNIVEEKLNYIFMVQMKRLERMMALEERTGMVFPMGYRNVDSLRMTVELMLKKEALRMFPIDAPQQKKNVSVVARRLAQFNDVDRNLICQLSGKFIQMIEDKKGATQTQNVGTNAQGSGEAENGIEGNGQAGCRRKRGKRGVSSFFLN